MSQCRASDLSGAPDSVRRTVNVLSSALRIAVEDSRIMANPVQRCSSRKRSEAGSGT
jgi:hypothetical protein